MMARESTLPEDISTYCSAVSFRFINPETRIRRLPRITLESIEQFLVNRSIPLDVLNTRIPDDYKNARERVRKLSPVPKMSTIAIGVLINQIVADMPKGQCFVNVGVWHGYTLLCGMVGNSSRCCIGIDNFSEFGGPKDDFLERFSRLKSDNHFFYEVDYEEYFDKHHRHQIGFYIYDGGHSYKDQLRGLQVAEPFLAPHSYILIDDTNLKEPKQATLDFLARSSFQYQLVFERTTAHNQHPTWWNGIMLLRKMS